MKTKTLLTAIIVMMMPLVAAAQSNTWETNENLAGQSNPAVTSPDAKYLEGAVPEVNGKVVFSATLAAPGKSAREIYDLLLAEMQRQAVEPGQFEQSRLSFADPDGLQLAGSYMEWLVFRSSALVLDRSRLMYHIVVSCRDGQADVLMQNIRYLYDEERQPEAIKAEEWITDKYGLNKKKDKLARVSGKFRRKTIDRKDYLFKRYETVLNQ